MASRNGGSSGFDGHLALERLVDLANSEPAATKKKLFLVVRCHRCLQHTRGGAKHDYSVTLRDEQWQWLNAVRERSKHPTVGKTLRIIIDFYRPILERDVSLEQTVFAGLADASGKVELAKKLM